MFSSGPKWCLSSWGKCLASPGSALGKRQPCIVGYKPSLQQNIALQAGPQLAVVPCFAVAVSEAVVEDSGHAWSLRQAAAALGRTATCALPRLSLATLCYTMRYNQKCYTIIIALQKCDTA